MTRGMMSSVRDDWETPQSLFNAINDVFHFTLDACASERNHKVDRYFSKANDGLAQSWSGEVVWCNPPYGREIARWAKKCATESEHARVVLLCAARPDTGWFADYVAPYARVAFIKGRLKFELGGGSTSKRTLPEHGRRIRRRAEHMARG